MSNKRIPSIRYAEGKKWGKWTSLGTVTGNRYGQYRVNVRCACGKESAVLLHALETSRSRSCHRCYTLDRMKFKIGSVCGGWKRLESDKAECLSCGRTVRISRNQLYYAAKNRPDTPYGCDACRRAAGVRFRGSVAIDGVRRPLSEWGRIIGRTRERARQLHKEGLLAARVRAVKSPD